MASDRIEQLRDLHEKETVSNTEQPEVHREGGQVFIFGLCGNPGTPYQSGDSGSGIAFTQLVTHMVGVLPRESCCVREIAGRGSSASVPARRAGEQGGDGAGYGQRQEDQDCR